MRPPILAYHLVFSTYGFWLPNEERGSWSARVFAPRLIRFGPPVAANTSRSLARNPYNPVRRRLAQAELKLAPVQFTLPQIACVGLAIGNEAQKYSLPIYAMAVMPDHVHLVTPHQERTAEVWIAYFKRAASRELRATGLHPFWKHAKPDGTLPTPWVEGGWKVYLHSTQEIRRTIQYVNNNPKKAGLPKQDWGVITPFSA